MYNVIFPVLRLATIFFWVVVTLSIMDMIPEPISTYILVLGGIIAVVHLIELFTFRQLIFREECKVCVLVSIMVFGFFWIIPKFSHTKVEGC